MEPLRQRDRQARLAGRGRAADDDERRRRRGHGTSRRSGERPAQRVRAGVLDADADERARRGPASPPRGRACSRASGRRGGRRPPAGRRTRRATPRCRRPARPRGRALGRHDGVDEDLGRRGPSHARLRSSPIASWSVEQPVEAAALHGGRDVVGELRGRRAGPLASTRPRRPGRSGRSRAAGASPRTRPRSRRRTRR